MIELTGVKKSFGKQEVLKDVSIKVDDGEVVVILGPSGSGKTTLLRSINFLEKADSGTMKFSDKIINFKNPKKLTQIFTISQICLFSRRDAENAEFTQRIIISHTEPTTF